MAFNALDVADGLADALETIVGLRVYPFPPDSVQPPAAVIEWPSVTYQPTYGGATRADATYKVLVVVSRAWDRAAFAALSPYLDGDGIKAAIEVDDTLGGVVDSVEVLGSEVSPIDIGGITFVGAVFTVQIWS